MQVFLLNYEAKYYIIWHILYVNAGTVNKEIIKNLIIMKWKLV